VVRLCVLTVNQFDSPCDETRKYANIQCQYVLNRGAITVSAKQTHVAAD